MIKHITLPILFVLLAYCCAAQKTVAFNLPEDSVITTYNVYRSLRVVDMRKDKSCVGKISDAPTDDQFINIETGKPLTALLSSYFDKISGSKKGEHDMLLVLHNFEIMQRTYNSGLGYFHFSGDFYMAGRNGKYALVDSLDGFYQLSGPGFPQSLTNFAGVIVYEVLNKQAARAVTQRWATQTEEDAIKRRERNKTMHAIYQGNFKEGIYYTIDQFLKNEPSDTTILFKEGYPGESKKLYNFWYKNDKGNKGERVAEHSFFAIYSAGTWYLGGEEYVKKMWYKDGEFVTNIRSVGPKGYTEDMNSQHSTTAAIGGGTFGLVGAAVASGIVTATNKREYIAPTIPVSYASRFDPATKKFFPFER
jgi:hypothetical protein